MIEQALKDREQSGNQGKTLPVEYRGQEILLPIISLNPNHLLLNNNNSRLKAQLEDSSERETINTKPFSTEGQKILQTLLAQTKEFSKLKDELKNLGQQEPGVINREGLLLNGNTRVAALRELNAEGVDVAVMPEGANDEDFLNLEMSLQMRKLTHQDYTFTNQLLLIEKYLKVFNSKEQLAKKMGWIRNKEKKYNENMQLISLINELRNINPESPIAYKEFDDKMQHLKDLNDAYQSRLKDNPAEAENLKWSRATAIFLGINKDRTREIDTGYIDDQIIPHLSDKEGGIKEEIENLKVVDVDNDGLSGILDDVPTDQVDPKKLAKVIIGKIGDKGSIDKDLPPELEELQKEINQRTENSIKKAKRLTFLSKPSDVLAEIREDLEQIVDDFGEAMEDDSFDHQKFDFNLKKVAKAVTSLQKDFAKFSKSK
jgi:hypothetical protein